MWVGQEVEDRGDANRFNMFSDWGQLKAIKEIANVTGVKVESRAFYDNLGPGFWRYNEKTQRFDSLTKEQYGALSDEDKKEVVRLNGRELGPTCWTP